MATHVYKDIPDDPLHPKHVTKKEKEVREIYERDPNSSTQKHLDSIFVYIGWVEMKFTMILSLDVMERAMYVGWVARYQRCKFLLLRPCLQTQMNALEERFNVFVAEGGITILLNPPPHAPLRYDVLVN
ncbi:hypothetical protein MKW92_010933, partial [Papaver armeniacum]